VSERERESQRPERDAPPSQDPLETAEMPRPTRNLSAPPAAAPGPGIATGSGVHPVVLLPPPRTAAELAELQRRAAGSQSAAQAGGAAPLQPLAAERAAERAAAEHETRNQGSSGLISSILGAEPTSQPDPDEGARAALRTLPRRAAPDLGAVSDNSAHNAERTALLLHLAQRSSGIDKARLLTSASELFGRAGEVERARAQLSAAVTLDPHNRVALRRLRREHQRAGELSQAAALFRREAELTTNPRERCLALCAAAELETVLGVPNQVVLETLRTATRANPDSLLAGLLLAQHQMRARSIGELSASLRECSQHAAPGVAQSLLLLEAARALEQTEAPAAALTLYREAHAAEPTALGALLGIVRTRNALGDRRGAVGSLAGLAERSNDRELAAEWRRQRGLLLLDRLNDPAQALAALRGAESAIGLRCLARAAEAAEHPDEHRRALQAWTEASGGMVRGLGLSELALLHARAAETDPALAALRKAGDSDAPNSLLRGASDLLLGTPQGAVLLANGARRDNEELLRAAAQLAAAADLGHERMLLSQVDPAQADALTAELLAFDAAAEQTDLPQLEAALARDIARWPAAARVGPLLAALDLSTTSHTTPNDERIRMLRRLADGQPMVTRYLAARASAPELSAELWLAEAVAASGGHAAFAATMAGRYLELAGRDPTEAYGDALDAVRGHLPAAVGLEFAARANADLSALERVNREIASTTESAQERCARRVRLGLLNADTDLAGATRWLELAAEEQPNDAVLDELAIRLSIDRTPAATGERLRSAAARESASVFARALSLQAADAFVEAGEWDAALGLYEQLLSETPDDLFTEQARWYALQRSGRLAAGSSAAYGGGSAPTRAALEALARSEPAHVPALRGLQREAMLARDVTSLAALSLQLSEALDESGARSAELQLGLRCEALIDGDSAAALLRAEGRVHELWYYLRCEALAIEQNDRARLFDALRAISELLRDPLERSAYALRAAEVLETAAPGRAAAELAETLLSAPEHPLAAEQLARLYKSAGDASAAARTFELAASRALDPRRALTLHYAAGALFQDELHDPARALTSLWLVAQSDILFADTFSRLRELLRQAERNADQRALIERRLAAPIEPNLALELEWERYQLCQLGADDVAARQALNAVLSYDPHFVPALDALAEQQERAAEYRAAAESLVRLARILDDDLKLAAALLRLGRIYAEHLADPKRAEIALTRASALMPEDQRPLELLAFLFEREGRHEDALRTLMQLIKLTPNAEQREAYVVQQAAVLTELGQGQAAAQWLEEARRLAPTSLRVMRAQAALFERNEDPAGRHEHLLRSCQTLRGAIEHDPSDPTAWLGLAELLAARGLAEGPPLVAAAARAFGLDAPQLSAAEPAGLGPNALHPELLAPLIQHDALDILRALLREQAAALAPHLPPKSPAELGMLAVDPQALHMVQRLFGLPEAPRLSSGPDGTCLPNEDNPLTLAVDPTLLAEASDAERFFLLLRAVAVAKLDCTLLVRCVPERIGLVLHALWQVVDRNQTVAVLDAQEQARVARELWPMLAPEQRPRVQSLIVELMRHDDATPRRLVSAALERASRVALLVSGDVSAAMNALLRLRGKQPHALHLADKIELFRADPALRGLLSFAISEQYIEVRRQAQLRAQERS
jgi:tetratricopeptide (TPR) repeat protein